ncbi:phosphatidylglycerol lysyltransferase domain-containing protein [Deinococcus ruber]|uniref:phosphatidylglycerol lysyltransferase domain-containing protein n=1 Tax=Deinococcus ruber TaxID=1848197 RepID=UPI00166F503E|nr:phosphatidylglycerol lysyltransferase domain-containing protein [Deinococcus ruber]
MHSISHDVLPSSAFQLQGADLDTLTRWHARYAVNPSSMPALASMTHVLTLTGISGGFGVQQTGNVLLAAGEPLAPTWAWPDFASALLTLARQLKAVPCFAPVGTEFAAILHAAGLCSVRLGSTPYIHLQDWPQRGNVGAKIRHAVNRAARDGVEIRAARPPSTPEAALRWRGEVEALCAQWLRERKANVPFHWVFELQPLRHLHAKRYFEARQGGQLVGLIAASPLPGRAGWYLEDVLQDPRASTSTGTALVAAALSALKADGVRLATLGGVPLSSMRGWDGADVTRLERWAYRLRPLLSTVYSFDGLERFKQRFGPAHWEDEYVVFPAGTWRSIRVGAALGQLILRGH